jgi:hypothetical protein
MARPDCPRCGSDLVVAAVPDSPSEWVEELRGGGAPARPIAARDVNWLCRACGLRWEPPPDTDTADLDAERTPDGDPLPMSEYAELLKLGPERSFANSAGESTLKALPDPRRRRNVVGAAMTVLAMAGVVVIAVLSTRSVPEESIPDRNDAPVVAQASPPASPSPPVPPERDGLRAVLHVNQPCWVRVIADGEIIDSITLAPGDTAVYRADRDLQFRLGNAGGVTLRVNGEPVQTGDSGAVVDLDVLWRHDEVRVRRA